MINACDVHQTGTNTNRTINNLWRKKEEEEEEEEEKKGKEEEKCI